MKELLKSILVILVVGVAIYGALTFGKIKEDEMAFKEYVVEKTLESLNEEEQAIFLLSGKISDEKVRQARNYAYITYYWETYNE
jgi:hypothetical protein